MAFEFLVPGLEAADLLISSLKPAHPTDDLWVKLGSDSLAHVIRFIRVGLTIDDLSTRRAYAAAAQPGLWNNGSAGLVQRVALGDVA